MSKTFSAKTLAVMLAAGLLTTGSAYAATAGAQEEAPQAVQQATGTCTGVVVDEENEPLVGATIRVEGTQLATATDIDGNFSIPNVKHGAKLAISYVGYSTVTITWDGTPLTIAMMSDSNLLDEVVIMGYGVEQKRAKVTNSISTVSDKVFSIGANANPTQALAGAVPGVKVNVTTGDPGAALSMVVRGGTSLDGTGAPVIVVDGQIRSSLSDINPNDIAEMQVLKDSGATALYGARAANGVLLITTKQGKIGSASVTFNAKFGLNYNNPGYNYVDARTYIYWGRRGLANTEWGAMNLLTSGGYGIPENAFVPSVNTTWNIFELVDQNRYLLDYGWETMEDPVTGKTIIFKDTDPFKYSQHNPGYTQDYNVSFSGGNDRGRYYASLGYYNQDGALKTTFYKRYNFAFTGSYKINNWLESNSIFNFTRANWQNGPKVVGNSGNTSYYFGRLLAVPHTGRWTDEDGNLLWGISSNEVNITYQDDKFYRNNQSDKFQMTQALTATILPGLTLKGTMSWYYNEEYDQSFNYTYQSAQNPNLSSSFDSRHETRQSFYRYFDQTYNLVANFNRTFNDKHYVNAMLGVEYYDRQYKTFSASGYGSEAPFPGLELTTQESRAMSSAKYEERILSYFGRLEYDYMDKYLIAATFREDGYSRLINNRWGFFPGVSAGWVFTKENFWTDNPDLQFFNYGKLRVSWGLNGSIPGTISYYGLQGAYSASDYMGDIGYALSSLPIPGLKWEKTRTAEVGVDLGFWQNRLNFRATFYDRLTSDKIASLSLPITSGFGSITTNNGSLRNRGLELELDATIIQNRDWSWTAGVNLTYNKTLVVSLPDNGLERNRQSATQVYNEHWDGVDPANQYVYIGGYQEGREPMRLIGWKMDHIAQYEGDWTPGYIDITPNQANGNARALYVDMEGYYKLLEMGYTPGTNMYKIQPGDPIYTDRNGDGVIDTYDRFDLGNRLPHWSGGFNTTLTWKGLSLYARFDMGFDFMVYDAPLAWALGQGQGAYNFPDIVTKTWTEESPSTRWPRYVYFSMGGTDAYGRTNDILGQRGAYLACRELSLSYTIPSKITQKFRCQNLTLSVTGQNLGYLKKCTNPLPDYTAGLVGNTAGFSGTYNLPRTVLFGLNVTF